MSDEKIKSDIILYNKFEGYIQVFGVEIAWMNILI